MSQAGTSQGSSGADRAVAGAVVRFAAYFVAMFAAIVLVAALGGMAALQSGLAQLVARLSSVTGVWAVAVGPLVLLSNRTLAIDLACTAIYIPAMYSALVLAYPVSLRTRLLGVAVGVPLIMAANVARLLATAHLAQAMPGAFDFVHGYLFQVGMILITVALWLGWTAYARHHAR